MNLKTQNIYRMKTPADLATAYRELAKKVEAFPNDTHVVAPFLPASDEAFEIPPWENARFCDFLREMAHRIESGDLD